jgi:hypothetical protein
MDEDSSGESVLDTLENLLNKKAEVTTLDLLNSLSVKAIHIDLDGWIEVANNWRIELKKQQKLISDLASFDELSVKREEITLSPYEIKATDYDLISLIVEHRDEPLKLEVWNPSFREKNRENWVLLMPGLGGDRNHFNWLARSLSHNGWPVVVLDHPGSDSLALEALVKGRLPLPGAEVIPDRLKDLDSVLKAKKLGEIDISAKKVVLMGHSLGALTAILGSGVKIAVRAPKE